MFNLKALFRRRQKPPEPRGTFVMDAGWERTEELRTDRLGPSEEDIVDPVQVRDPWRPTRSLGPLPKL